MTVKKPVTGHPPTPEVVRILDEFSNLEGLLIRSLSAVKALRCEPHIVARQVDLVLIARQYNRDCTVLAYQLNRMAMS